jgi:hypothetical protein
MTGDRNYTRQQGELDLLRTPVKDLGQKVIYMTNVDTSLFRRTDLLGMTPFESKHDLDYLTHVRVYAATPQDVVGATAVAPSGAGAANAVLVSMRRILTMPEKEKDVFAQTHKTRFVIAMPGQMSNPPKKSVEEAMNRLGVNLVPLNLFGVREELKKTLGLWPNDKFLRTRPPALQVLSSAGAAAAANV